MKKIVLNIGAVVFLFGASSKGIDIKEFSDSKQLLSSVMTLVIDTKDGKQFNATAFLAISDKIAVTSWQVVKNARSITARFPNGEEFEVSGLVDNDVRKNIALLKIKIFGHPLLTWNTQEPRLGEVGYYLKKDFSLGKTTIGKIEVSKGVKMYYLSSSLSYEEIGGPLLNSRGEVLGVLGLIGGKNGNSISVAVPSSYVLALDSTLQAKPWEAVKSPGGSIPFDADAIDAEIVESLVQLSDHFSILNWACRQTYGMGYRNGVPKLVYENMEELKSQFKKISVLKPYDQLRARILQEIKQGMVAYLQGTDLYIKSIVIAQGSSRGWGAKSQDLFNRADALISSFPTQSLIDDLKKLKEKSKVFQNILPMEIQYSLDLVQRPSGYALGVTNYVRNPFFLLIVEDNSVAERMGLRAGDTIISLNGHKFTHSESIEDFKVMLKSYRGQKVKAVVKRNNKLQEITLKVPRNL